jgi:hypothetical protein
VLIKAFKDSRCLSKNNDEKFNHACTSLPTRKLLIVSKT